MTNVTVEKDLAGYVVRVRVETKERTMYEVLKEAARALQIEVLRNERTNSGNRPTW